MFQCEASDKLGPGLCLATQTYNASSDKTQRFLRKHFLCTRISILRIGIMTNLLQQKFIATKNTPVLRIKLSKQHQTYEQVLQR